VVEEVAGTLVVVAVGTLLVEVVGTWVVEVDTSVEEFDKLVVEVDIVLHIRTVAP
jgi:hypothetical protein